MNLQDDDFTLFGLPRQFALSRSELDARWRALQSEVHPDRFAAQGPAAQRVAMQWAVRVNEAHQRLKDPIKRGAYLCELLGGHVNADRNTDMPSAFLVQQMSWREALDDAVDAGAIRELDEQVALEERALMDRLADSLDRTVDAGVAAQTVRALMFLAKFRDDLRRRLDALED